VAASCWVVAIQNRRHWHIGVVGNDGRRVSSSANGGSLRCSLEFVTATVPWRGSCHGSHEILMVTWRLTIFKGSWTVGYPARLNGYHMGNGS
jgi:hypothetical protein